MTFTFYIILAVLCVQVLWACESPLDEAEMKAVQERLATLEGIEKTIKSLMAPEESREDKKCLPIGAGCSFASGPNCCGIRTRCVIFDYADPAPRGGSAKWHSACREYNGGVAIDEIIKFFQRWG